MSDRKPPVFTRYQPVRSECVYRHALHAVRAQQGEISLDDVRHLRDACIDPPDQPWLPDDIPDTPHLEAASRRAVRRAQRKRAQPGPRLLVVIGYEGVAVRLTQDEWQRVLASESVVVKGEGYCYDCVPHQDSWYFNHGEAGALYVEYEADDGDGGDVGVGFDGGDSCRVGSGGCGGDGGVARIEKQGAMVCLIDWYQLKFGAKV